jgi:ATP-dependent RNA helicase RhlE
LTEQTFAGFGLAAPLEKALAATGFAAPTPIQAGAIPPQMAGRDVIGLAETGTGKTAAFVLPMLHALLNGRPQPKSARALILSPTRELAVQIEETIRALRGTSRISTVLVLGGTSRSAQVRALARGVDIVIATPGRLLDLVDEGCVSFADTRILVLDEADRMLDMGFIKPVQQIVRLCHRDRRTALFSATMPAEVESLAASLLRDPVRVEVSPPGKTVQAIRQSVELVDTGAKRSRLAAILTGDGVGKAIVFTRTKRGADRVAENLEKDGIPAAAIHGNKSQNARQRALDEFRTGKARVLVASDIAARGIDVKDITHVVQYDMPDEPEAYVHRIGRTGRNGAEGIAIALCAPDERAKLKAVEKLTRSRLLPEGAAESRPQANGGRPPAAQARHYGTPRPAGTARPQRRRRGSREEAAARG